MQGERNFRIPAENNDTVLMSSSPRRCARRQGGIVFSRSGIIMKPIGREINSGHFLPITAFCGKKLSLFLLDSSWRHA
ncbi:hypothetical protein LptCag_0172 [Leptospirillum ferriphilum]|uniref:Uncharacterized protein n=1 Tax=Leptospirillum ferriphilum TaxID=178606 RepID=A0A094X4T4_9BACT|nr:hypothetical protein LptCag_0172 [Leptospirillum ferriphilum]